MIAINCLSQWANVSGSVHITQKVAVIDNERKKRLSAAVVKMHWEFWDTDSDNENDTDSSYDLSDLGSESDSSDLDI